MASIREYVFSDGELLGLVDLAYAQAAYMLGRNRQDSYEVYEKLGTGLNQVIHERNALREATHAGRTESKKGSDTGGAEQASPGKRKRVQREPGAG